MKFISFISPHPQPPVKKRKQNVGRELEMETSMRPDFHMCAADTR